MTWHTGIPATLRRTAARGVRAVGRACLAGVLAGLVVWAALAVCLADLSGGRPRYAWAAVVVLVTAAGVVAARRGRLKWVVPLLPFAAVLVWFLSLRPSNDRDWRADVARVASAEVRGDAVVVRNVRNFDFRSDTEAAAAWEDRTYDLSRLKTVDLILCYWGSKSVAHVITSFGFDDGQFLDVSIETRLERGEAQSGLQSLFRQYELIYVFADERDVVRVRTNRRDQDVYLYRTRLAPAEARAVLISFLARANSLAARPEWYNTLTANCTTSVLPHARAAGAPGRWSLDVLFSGRAARQAYANGLLDTRVPFEELEAGSLINSLAKGADRDPEFSRRIRAGLAPP